MAFTQFIDLLSVFQYARKLIEMPFKITRVITDGISVGNTGVYPVSVTVVGNQKSDRDLGIDIAQNRFMVVFAAGLGGIVLRL